MGNWISKPPPGIQIDLFHPLARGLAHLWPINAGAGLGLVDILSPAYNGTFGGTTGLPTWAGAGLRFGGASTNQHVAFPSGLVDWTGGTLLCIGAAGSNDGTQRLLFNHRTSGQNDRLYILRNASSADVTMRIGNDVVLTGAGYFAPWKRAVIAMSFDSTNLAAAINGNFIGSTTHAGTTQATLSYVGAFAGISASWDGSCELLAFWNRRLNETELRAITTQPYALFRRSPFPLIGTQSSGVNIPAISDYYRRLRAA